MPCISLNLAKQEVKMTKSSDGIHQATKATFSPKFEHTKETGQDIQSGQLIRVESLSADEFSVTLERGNNLSFVVFLSDDYYKSLTFLFLDKKFAIFFALSWCLSKRTSNVLSPLIIR